MALSSEDVELYAEQLVGAHARHQLIPTPAADLGSVGEAYRIQDAVANALGPVAGWKVGAKSPSALPSCAPLVSASIINESNRAIIVGTGHIGIELEIAYRLARSFFPRLREPGDAEILGSIASAHIAIELCRSRFIDGPLAPPLWLLADNQMNHLLVLGAQIHNWRDIECDPPVARLSINGELVDVNPGGHPAKSPFQLLAWLVRHAVARRGGLYAGSIVTTGSWTGSSPLPSFKANFAARLRSPPKSKLMGTTSHERIAHLMGNEPRRAGRHFLQIPGPTPVPDRILRAMDKPVIDHRGPEFKALGLKVLSGIKSIFKTSSPVFIYPSSGTGAWEAALVNTLSPGDKVLMYETGHFATLWKSMATKLGLQPEFITSDWRGGADAAAIEARLKEDKGHTIKAVCVVHNETSTGATSRIDEVRCAIDAARHPALLMVDTISSLASIDYQHDEWGVDVTVGGSQKGLMLPPGLGFNAVSEKALAAGKASKLAKSYFAWDEMLPANKEGFFPYTPATNLLSGLAEAIDMLHEEGLEGVFARHDRHAEGVRRAVRAWGLEIWCKDPKYYSSSLTAILMPSGHNADTLRKTALEHFDVSLGAGLTKLAGKVFRIGHLGDINDLTMIATLAGVEMGLGLGRVPHEAGGVQEAMKYFASSARVVSA